MPAVRNPHLPQYEHNFVVAVQKTDEDNAYLDEPGGFAALKAAEAEAARLAAARGRKAIVWDNCRTGIAARYGPDGRKI